MNNKKLNFDDIEVKSLTDIVYEKIKEAILNGKLAQGSRISERILTEELGVSSSPIKRALQILQVEGLVEIRPRSGTYVTNSFTNMDENIVIRAYLEGLAAKFAAEKAGEADIEGLKVQLDIMEVLTRARNHEKIIEANSEFHLAVHRISQNQYIQQLIDVLRGFSSQLRVRVLSDDDELTRGLNEHTAVFNAIREHDGLLAEEIMRSHVLHTLDFMQNEPA